MIGLVTVPFSAAGNYIGSLQRKRLSHAKSLQIRLILQTGVVKSDTKNLYRLSQKINVRFLTRIVLGDSISGLNEKGSSLISGAESANVGDLEIKTK